MFLVASKFLAVVSLAHAYCFKQSKTISVGF